MSDPENEPDGAAEVEEFLAFIEQIELCLQRGEHNEVYAELKRQGYDTRAVKKIVALRKRVPADVEKEDALLDTYKRRLGMDGCDERCGQPEA